MTIHDILFENHRLDSEIGELLKGASKNWINTRFERYPLLSSKAKGTFGEKYVEALMKERFGSSVLPSSHTDHDRIIDNYKTEIKFGLATSPKSSDYKIKINSFVFNHIACHKKWDRLIFCGINPASNCPNIDDKSDRVWDELNVYYMDKKDFESYMNKPSDIFRPQQGGKGGSNDDYMVSGHIKFKNLIELPFVKHISEWR